MYIEPVAASVNYQNYIYNKYIRSSQVSLSNSPSRIADPMIGKWTIFVFVFVIVIVIESFEAAEVEVFRFC